MPIPLGSRPDDRSMELAFREQLARSRELYARKGGRLLAALARGVNDLTSDAGRAKLAELIPSVIGLTGDDVRIDARIALRAATTALPVAAEERQRILAISVLVAERLLASVEGRPAGSLEERSRWALAQAPMAAKWARRYMAKCGQP